MAHFDDTDPIESREPQERGDEGIWKRGLWMLLFVIMFSIAETILGVIALVQWLFMLVTKQRNAFLQSFGRDLGRWMADVALYQSGESDDKPFPFRPWAS